VSLTSRAQNNVETDLSSASGVRPKSRPSRAGDCYDKTIFINDQNHYYNDKKILATLSSEELALTNAFLQAAKSLASFKGTINFNISVSSSLLSATDVRPEKEPRLKQLFDDPKRTEEESNRFLNFLSDHNISSRLIDSSQDNPILKAIVCFCVKWRNLRYIEQKYSPSAVLRFLTDTCSLQTDRVADRAIANALGVMIKNGYNKVLYEDVCDYF